MLETPPLSLYVHIPWCVRKCPYCDFNSHQLRDNMPEADYVAALCDDLAYEVERLETKAPLTSIFIGGGTPSLFKGKSYGKLFSAVDQLLGIDTTCEITLEANPGTVDAENFRAFRDAGINRLSLGIQSFDDDKLKSLGRIHGGDEAKRAIDIARGAGFENFNLDLMFGLPEQKVSQAIRDLQTAIGFEPTHISWYQLTIEANTEFHSRPPKLPPEPAIIELQDEGIALLADSGFDRYEVSAFAQQGMRAAHNMNYWEFGDYIGIGAGAHGKVSHVAANRIVRTRKKKQPDHYLAATLNRDAERVEVTMPERPFEFLLNALRLRHGFEVSLFEKRTGVTFSEIEKKVDLMVSQGLLVLESGRLSTTERGYRVLNSILEEFLD
jgi:putative oxygen-independent coproporphyrinogen III oxidase